MKLLGLNYKKISVEKLKDNAENINISSSINVSEINKYKTDLFKTKEDLLEIKFNYSVNYAPEVAKLEITGSMIISVEPKVARNVLNKWKDKELDEDFKLSLFNLIIRKTSIISLELEDEVNIPYHIPLPRLRKKETSSEGKRE